MQVFRQQETNYLPKNNTAFLVEGLPEVNIQPITRGSITKEVGVVQLANQVRVPSGVLQSGEFTVTVQFGRDEDRIAFENWISQCIYVSTGNVPGVDSRFKKEITIINYRLITAGDNQDTTNGNTNFKPVITRMIGCWVSSHTIPESDMAAVDGDAYSTMEITIQYDSISSDAKAVGNTTSTVNVTPLERKIGTAGVAGLFS